jgi:putative membrane protein
MMMWGGWPNMMGGLFGGIGFIWMIFIFIFILAIVAGIIILIVWAVRRSGSADNIQKIPENKALDALKERYAKGEITKEEYENIKKDIG